LSRCRLRINNSQSGDVLILDSALLEQSFTMRDYFQGNGAPEKANPGMQDTIYANDCKWETRTHYNFVAQPNFSSGWTNLTQVSSGTDSVTSVYGIHNGKVSGAVTVTNTVTLPSEIVANSQDIVASVYLYSKVQGTYAIRLTDTLSAGNDVTATFRVGASQVNKWIRLHVKSTTISTATQYKIWITSSQAGNWYLNGPQLELGAVPSSFVDFLGSQTISKTLGSSSYTAAREPILFGSQSNLFTRYAQRFIRLNANLPTQLRYGADFSIVTGLGMGKPVDSDSSIALSSSFESSTYGWSGVNATLYRDVAWGYAAQDTALYGGAYCTVTQTSAGEYGIQSDFIPITQIMDYYLAFAVKPLNSSAYGNYTIRVDWYDSNKNAVSIDNGATNYYTSATSNVQYNNNWAYISLISRSGTSAYAKIKITTTSGSQFNVDHVIFRSN